MKVSFSFKYTEEETNSSQELAVFRNESQLGGADNESLLISIKFIRITQLLVNLTCDYVTYFSDVSLNVG